MAVSFYSVWLFEFHAKTESIRSIGIDPGLGLDLSALQTPAESCMLQCYIAGQSSINNHGREEFINCEVDTIRLSLTDSY